MSFAFYNIFLCFDVSGDGDATEQNEPLLSSLDDSSTVSLTQKSSSNNNTSVVNVLTAVEDEHTVPLLIGYEVIN